MTPPAPAPRRLTPWLALAVVVALVGSAAFVWWRGGVGSLVGRELCEVSRGDQTVELDLDQVKHAGTIAAVAERRGLPRRALVVAYAAALQESKLQNLAGGDRDSAGLFQQRPSQGWGRLAEVRDPDVATDRFFDRLLTVTGWEALPITEAAQAVQRSAFPDAYQQHAEEAQVLAAAYSGRAQAAVTCTVRAEAQQPQAEQADGLTGRATRLRAAISAAFGELPLGGFAPGGVQRANPSAHNDGRAIDVFFRPHRDPGNRRAGWVLAHWLVAHADQLDLAVVIFDDRIWSAARSPEGWRAYRPPFGDPTDPVNRHLDHVHVDVY